MSLVIFYQTPLALHWNGKVWNVVPVPNPSGCTGHSYLTAVSASAPFAGPLSECSSQGAWHTVRVPVAFGSLDSAAVDAGAALWAAETRLDGSGVDVPPVLMRPAATAGP